MEANVESVVAPPEAGQEAVPAAPLDDGGVPAEIQPSDWEATQFPDGFPLADKYANFGEFHKAFNESGQEALKLKNERDRLATLAEGYRQLIGPQQQPQPQAQPQQTGYFGFPSQQAYQAAFQADHEGTMDRLLQNRFQSPQMQQLIDERVNQSISPLQTQLQSQMQQAQVSDLFNRYPDSAPGQPGHDNAIKFVQENPHIAQFAADHGMSAAEVAYKLANFDFIAGQQAGLESRLDTQRGIAATARPGSGGVARIKDDGTPASAVRMAAQDIVDSGGDPLTPDQLADAERAAMRHLSFQ